MTTKDDGGPAFPVSGKNSAWDGDPSRGWYTNPGMTLRQWYAGKAMQGMLTEADTWESRANIVKQAFIYADAMIAEGKK